MKLQAIAAMTALLQFSNLSIAEEPAPVAAKPAASPEAERFIKTNIESNIPGIVVQNIVATPSPSFLEVQLSNGEVVYASQDGKHFVLGALYEFNQSQGLVNLTEQAKNTVRAEHVAGLKEDQMVVFKAKGEEIAKINVFTDIDCGYCRKLHQEVPRLNELGVTVRYLAYPRAGIMGRNKEFTASFKKIKSVWCDENPTIAMTKAKETGYIKDNLKCEAPIAEQFKLGQDMGVTGTPAIVTMSGKLIPGYMKAEALLERIKS